VLVEPLGDAVPFSPRDQAAISAARADDQCGTIWIRCACRDGRVGCLESAVPNRRT
jgi:hypothetical protein